MKLIVGLGNPGNQYARTRHNLGFMVVDELAVTQELDNWSASQKFNADITQTDAAERKALLAKPQTYMNLSGEAVQRIAQFYKIEPKDIWVIQDDLDLEFGQLRIRKGGSSGGHNGIKSIANHIGEDFWRFRIGIKNAELKNPLPADEFVLRTFNETETSHLTSIVKQVAEIVYDHLNDSGNEHTTYTLI